MRKGILNSLIPLLLGIFLIFSSFYSYTRYQHIDRTKLVKISGTLKGWYYQNDDFIIKLNEFPADFCIWSVCIPALDDRFKLLETKGNKVSLIFLKKDYGYLNIKKEIEIYGLSSNEYEYLKIDDVDKRQRDNAILGLIIGCISFIILIFLSIIFYKFLWFPKAPSITIKERSDDD